MYDSHVHVSTNERIKESHSNRYHYNQVHVARKVVPNTLLIIMNLNP